MVTGTLERAEVSDETRTDLRRWWPYAAVAGGYAVLRVVIAWAAGPFADHADTSFYLIHPVDLLGRSPRPWLVTLPMHALHPWGYITWQALFSAFAFCVLAAAVASTVQDRRVKVGVAAVVLLLGLSPRTTVWDSTLLSESPGIATTALLIAALIWLPRLPVWAFGVVFTMWLLTKEAHLYLGVLVLLGLTVWGWRQRRWTVPAVVLLAMLWGGWTYSNDKWAEEYNVLANVAYHVGNDPDMFRWFVAEGMPPSDAFFEMDQQDRFHALAVDPEFARWVKDDGEFTYAEYLATHPAFLLEGPIASLFTHNAREGWSMTDHQEMLLPTSAGVPFWPIEGTAYTDLLILAAILCTLVAAARSRIDGRWVLPGLLAASSIPHAVFVFHGAPWELERHAAELAFVLVVSCWWTIALAADTLLRSVPTLGVSGGLDGGDVDV